MSAIPDSFPSEKQIFDTTRKKRFFALAVETVVQDVSPTGDEEVAEKLTEYMFGERQVSETVPAYVEFENETLLLSNPPFLLAEIDLSENDDCILTAGLDSELQLLIHPPVWVTIRGPFDEVLGTFEQILVEIYRTKGRRLEMIDNRTIDSEAYADSGKQVTVEWKVEDSSQFSLFE